MPPVVPIAVQGPPAPITGKIRSGERVADVLERAGVSVLEIDRALATLTGKVDFTKTRVGDRYVVEPAAHGKLARFVYETSPLNAWTVRADGDGYVAEKKDVKVERVVTLVEGEVGSSLYQAFIDAGEGAALAMQLAHVYRYDIDFNTETRKGDRFRLYVEKDEVEGETVGYGRILAAEYGERRLFELDGAYYDENGKAAKKAFLKSPLAFTRISSAFGYRTHPITRRKHFHGGVDYAAPTGTPVQSVADGVVTFAARKGPNGKMVKVRHPGGYESYYLHLSRILVKRGQRVSQSTLVGRVGSTGRSTGPHLDFRLKQNGKYLNPTKKVAARHFGVPKKSRKKFRALVKKWGHRLDGSERLVMAGNGSHLP
ncbi:MAG: peptidoglycan DD-metalloendopeptidase family protein [Deltaproteobacteria bacterium]